MTKLTPVEAQAHGWHLEELRARKCHTCKSRQDVGGWEDFFCRKGESVTKVMNKPKCKKWELDENKRNWLND